MPKRRSAGLVLYRILANRLEVLAVHPGGPFWRKKDAGAWFIPKGEIEEGEDEFMAAKREFMEETGLAPDTDTLFIDLGEVRHRSGKTVRAWAFQGDCDPTAIRSNTFSLEWPPNSGRRQLFPEIDRAAFFGPEEAARKMHPDEYPLIERLAAAMRLEQREAPEP